MKGGVPQIDRDALGRRLRELRRARRWTLADVSARTGLAVSTISKAERGLIGLAYDKFLTLARRLDLDVADLFPVPAAAGDGISINRAGRAPEHHTANYVYRMLSTDRRDKRMVPMWGRIKARDVRDFDEFVRHPGEEFLFILEGTLSVHIEGRGKPIRLNRHDSLYFNSDRGHVYVSAGRSEALILVVCVERPPDGP